MQEWKKRTGMLLGENAMQRLERSHVAVFGVGGVGSFAAEALARSGIGQLTLVDFDAVGESNRNRQLEALGSTLGENKARALAHRLQDACPGLRIHAIDRQYLPECREEFFSPQQPYDYVVDAIDLVTCKLDLIETCQKKGTPILSAMGTGNKVDLTALRVADLEDTVNCGLARVMRRELRRRGITHLDVVYSPEPAAHCPQPEAPPPGRRSVPGSVIWVPGAAGLLLASEVIRRLTIRE